LQSLRPNSLDLAIVGVYFAMTIVVGHIFRQKARSSSGFWGLLVGTLSSIAHNLAYRMHWLSYGSDKSANFYSAIFAFTSCPLGHDAAQRLHTLKSARRTRRLAPIGQERTAAFACPGWRYSLACVALVLCAALSIAFR
jgi:solute:Na+ symporter, SSS family